MADVISAQNGAMHKCNCEVDCSPHVTFKTASFVYRCRVCKGLWVQVGNITVKSAATMDDDDAVTVLESEAEALNELIKAEARRER